MLWGFRFDGMSGNTFAGQVAFNLDYSKVVAVSYDSVSNNACSIL